MTIKNNQNGSAILFIILAVLSVSVFGVGFYFYNSNKSRPSDNTANSFKPSNFSECVKAGGVVYSNDVPQGSGFDSSSNLDSSVTNTHCQYPKTPGLGINVDDYQCNNRQVCDEIEQSTMGICNDLTNKQNLTPTFKYYPVVKDSFARLYLTDCSPYHYKKTIAATLILKKTDAGWTLFRKFTSSLPCSEVDGAGIPLELATSCQDPSAGFRPPK